jgi:hypothetical protein
MRSLTDLCSSGSRASLSRRYGGAIEGAAAGVSGAAGAAVGVEVAGLAGGLYFGVVGAVAGTAGAVLTSPLLSWVGNSVLKAVNHKVTDSIGQTYHVDCARRYPTNP